MAKDLFTKLGSTRADLEVAWQDRLADAQALVVAGRPAGAIADTIYALEIRLKALICKRLRLVALPRAFEIHDLPSLLLLAGLSRRMESKKAAQVRANWVSLVAAAQYINDLRYKPDQNWTLAQATAALSQLVDPPDGVFPWLSNQ